MSNRRPLSLIDATFLRIESIETPMHVASLMVVAPPAKGAKTFAREIVARFRQPEGIVSPFDMKLATGPRSHIAPALVPAGDIDLTYHVRHTRLPAPSGERELGELVSHLHGTLLDRSRPLWTCHVIEGLQGGRVAIYSKVHHALFDGVKGIRLTTAAAATAPGGEWSAPWYLDRTRSPRNSATPRRSPLALPAAIPGAVANTASDALSLAAASTSYLRRPGTEPVRVPFEAPRSKLNGPVTAARRVATQSLDLDRVRAIGHAADASVNDVFLAVCASAIRRHLADSDDLPGRPLIAGVPINIADETGKKANSSGFSLASLATDLDDPLERLATIKASMAAVKQQLARVNPRARLAFLTATFAPAMGVIMAGVGSAMPPPMNVTISNVPGPRKPIYINGGEVEALYPVSIPFQGQALNITCISYDGHLDIGFTGSRDSLPHLQRLALHTKDALEELECALGIPSAAKV